MPGPFIYEHAEEAVEPYVGQYLINVAGGEFQPGGMFNYSFLYGAQDGRLSFLEPMIALSVFENLRAAGNQEPVCLPIPGLPQRFPKPGYYPTQYCVQWLPHGRSQNTFAMFLTQFHRFEAPANEFQRRDFAVDQIEDAFTSFNCTTSDDDLGRIMVCGDGVCSTVLETSNCSDCEMPARLIESYNRVIQCLDTQELVEPKTVLEVQQTVWRAAMTNQTVRPHGSRHSSSETFCTKGIAVNMSSLNHIFGILDDPHAPGKKLLHIQAGAKLQDVQAYTHEHDYSIGYACMGFGGITIGGAVGTGAHGTSPHPSHKSFIVSLVEAVTLVNASGHLVHYKRATTDERLYKAIVSPHGLLGIMVEFWLRIEPQFLLAASTQFVDDTEMFATPNGVFDLLDGWLVLALNIKIIIIIIKARRRKRNKEEKKKKKKKRKKAKMKECGLDNF